MVEEDEIDGDRTEVTANGGFIEKTDSEIGRVENYLSIAVLGDTIFSLGVDNNELRFINEKKSIDLEVECPKSYTWQSIA